MKNNTAIFFPDTLPREHLLIPLVLVFEEVVYCQPVENDDSGDSLHGMLKTLEAESLCRFHAPAPLGENRERFLKLIHDIRSRRDDYAAQLANVSLAGLSAAEHTHSETKGAILSNLLAEHGITNTAAEKIEQLLWQARLVLKLGELFDTEQENMAEHMQAIRERENSLFSEMASDDDNPFSLTGRLNSLAADTGRMQLLRLKSWSRLFAFGKDEFAPDAFVSDDQDAVIRLLDFFEAERKHRPNRILTLDLPLPSTNDESFPGQLRRFKKEEGELLANLAAAMNGDDQADGEFLNAWNTSLAKWFPERGHMRSRLELYLFDGVKPKRLFLDCFGRDEGDLEENISGDDKHDIVVGLLNQIK